MNVHGSRDRGPSLTRTSKRGGFIFTLACSIMACGVHTQFRAPRYPGSLEMDPTAPDVVSEGWGFGGLGMVGRTLVAWTVSERSGIMTACPATPVWRYEGLVTFPFGLHGRGRGQTKLYIEVRFCTEMLGLCRGSMVMGNRNIIGRELSFSRNRSANSRRSIRSTLGRMRNVCRWDVVGPVTVALLTQNLTCTHGLEGGRWSIFTVMVWVR